MLRFYLLHFSFTGCTQYFFLLRLHFSFVFTIRCAARVRTRSHRNCQATNECWCDVFHCVMECLYAYNTVVFNMLFMNIFPFVCVRAIYINVNVKKRRRKKHRAITAKHIFMACFIVKNKRVFAYTSKSSYTGAIDTVSVLYWYLRPVAVDFNWRQVSWESERKYKLALESRSLINHWASILDPGCINE